MKLELADSLDLALNFILKNKKEFSLKKQSEIEAKLLQFKPFAELLLTLNILFKYKHSRPALNDLRYWLWDEIEEGKLLLDLFAVRPDLIVLSCIYADFVDLGFKNNHLNDFLKYLYRINPTSNLENPFWRKLDIAYSYDRLGFQKFSKSPLYGAWVNKNLPPWTINNDLAYAITHEVFYVTDFGIKANRLGTNVTSYVNKWLQSWIEIFSLQSNLDLVAEFLMVGKCIKYNKPIEKYFKYLIENQNTKGFIPSPAHTGTALFSDTDSPQRREFLSNYHTTLVSIMAFTMQIQSKTRG